MRSWRGRTAWPSVREHEVGLPVARGLAVRGGRRGATVREQGGVTPAFAAAAFASPEAGSAATSRAWYGGIWA